MKGADPALGVIRFGVFELDPEARELRKRGIRVKLQDLPFRILEMLLERAGELVGREDLRNRLWSPDTFVDFDHSLNTAVTRVREALGDSADQPRYIETVPKHGYRFIAPVSAAPPTEDPVSDSRTPSPEGSSAVLSPVKPRSPGRYWFAAAVLVILGAVLAGWWWQRAAPVPRVSRISKVTSTGDVAPVDANLEIFPALLTDGARLYFLRTAQGRTVPAQVSAAGGEAIPLTTPLGSIDPWLVDITSDGSQLLIREPLNADAESPLWVLPTVGGGLRRISGIQGHDGTWLRDGQRIVYADGNDLLTANLDGSDSRKLVTAPGRPFWPRWSPDRTRLRFTLRDPRTSSLSLWEVTAEGKNLHPLLPGWNAFPSECCGNWTPDGAYFVFQSSRSGIADIWAMRENAGRFAAQAQTPVRLTGGPLEFEGPVLSKDGKRIFVLGVENRSELFKYDENSRRPVAYLDLPAITPDQPEWLSFSLDNHWVAFTGFSDHTLWRAKPDGTDRLQLTLPPMQVYLPRWSPDGKRIVFAGKMPGQPWRIYLVSSAGGGVQQLLQDEHNENDPDWSPDGKQILFGRTPDYMAEASTPKAVYVYDLTTKQVSTIPGSDGLYSPRWSPDGRYIAALPLDESRLMLFDFKDKKWSTLVVCNGAWPIWSRDGKYVYGITKLDGAEVANYRLRLSDHQLERIASVKDVQRTNVTDLIFAGMTPDDSLLLLAHESSADIYALEWPAP
jgi:Tol biopolymer transport system component/DNA-binding winged helix-turn-helix (wHTH) protein